MSEGQKIEIKEARSGASQARTPRRTISPQIKTIITTVLTTLIVLAMLFGFWLLIFHKKPTKKNNEGLSVLKTAQRAVNFPVFYAKPQPTYKLDTSSVSTGHGLITFAYKYGGDNISITEQPKPPVIEQVTKTRSFDTPVGSAYLADLNGHTAGFIQANKTLIILSSQNNIADKLQNLMINFQKL